MATEIYHNYFHHFSPKLWNKRHKPYLKGPFIHSTYAAVCLSKACVLWVVYWDPIQSVTEEQNMLSASYRHSITSRFPYRRPC